MTASTSTYGLPYEVPGDKPGVTLTGEDGADILAEAVETELERIDSDIQDVSDAATEAGLGWVPISEGSASNVGNLDIDLTDDGRFPAGTFREIEITINASQDTTAVVICRINNDDTAGLHRAGFITWALSDGSVVDSESNTSTNRYKIGQFVNLSGNTARILLQRCDESSNVPMQATATAPSSSVSMAAGRLEANRLVDSVRIGHDVGGVTFGTIRWQARGYRVSST